jgi:hypothetical protein
MDLSVIASLVANFATENPKFAGFCAVAYVIGLASKAVREAAVKFVQESPSKEDDKKLAEIESKPAVKAVLFVLDFFLRFKKPGA